MPAASSRPTFSAFGQTVTLDAGGDAWLRDDSLEDADSLPAPDAIAAEIVKNLEAALEEFRAVAEELGAGK